MSISTAMALTYIGARTETAEQMAVSMKFKGIDDLHKLYQELNIEIFEKTEGCTLNMANRLFGRKDYEFLTEFLSLCGKHYGSELLSLDFAGDPAGSRKVINDWVLDKTSNKIKDLIPDGIINPLTALILVNAIYFKGNWADQFDPEATTDLAFHLNKNNLIKVPMMQRKGKYSLKYDQKRKCSILELPYVDKKLSMFIILPDDVNGLESLEEELKDPELFKSMSQMPHPREIVVVMPKFRIEWGETLNDALSKLGMKHAFDETLADFSGMDGKRMLYISKVIHKAFIEVNEEGSEAAAATAVVMMMRCAPRPPQRFVADHPFIFLIRDNNTGSILFMGRLCNPKA